MKAARSEISAALAPLANLQAARRGPAAYYLPLLRADDEFVRFGAFWNALNLKVLPPEFAEQAIELSRFLSIKIKAFDYFVARFDYAAAERVAATAAGSLDEAVAREMAAELAADQVAMSEAAAERYRASGDIADLGRAGIAAERGAGWRSAVDWFVRLIAIAPLDAKALRELYRILLDANQFAAIEELAAIMNRAGLHPYANAVFLAAAKLGKGDPKGAARDLQALKPPAEASPVQRELRGQALKLLGEALDKAGEYPASHRAFIEMNRHDLAVTVDSRQAQDTARMFNGMEIPALPPERRRDIVNMLGFARSGTTLLEIALDSHPLIEAFEERPPMDVALAHIHNARRAGTTPPDRVAFFTDARELYYREIDRIRRKDTAELFIDKYPMRTMYAGFLDRFLPEQKSIFCIRHPYDVVLSCFRQRFSANPAMESFRDWSKGIAFYDFVMTQWFDTYGFDDPRVHYLRYDDLVTDFEPTMRNVLDFLGMPWTEDVAGFDTHAESKGALTPSYQKIRRGLSIGVQTYWRNYAFLFSAPEAKPLRRWAAHFGYPVD